MITNPVRLVYFIDTNEMSARSGLVYLQLHLVPRSSKSDSKLNWDKLCLHKNVCCDGELT